MNRVTAALAAALAAAPALLAPLAPAQQVRPGVEIPRSEHVRFCYPGEDGALTGHAAHIDTAPSRDSGFAVHRGDAAVTTIYESGPTEKRIDIVFVGDGYTQAELPLFHAQVHALADALFEIEPFKSYKSRFNIHMVDVVSNESGVDNDPTLGVMRDTALDMEFWCNGVERSLCVDSFKARSFAALAPDDDQVVALANSTSYGGAAFFGTLISCVSAGNEHAHSTIVHELGHSFITLEDEYTYGGPNTYTGPEPGRRNVSIYNEAEQISLETKWWRWMGDETPGFDGPAGTYEGGLYSRFGIFRPSVNSLMRNLHRPFNMVAVERALVAMYNTDDPFSLFDDVTQPWLGEFYGHDSEFFVEPVHPVSHPMTVWWQLGTEVIPGQTGDTLRVCELQLQPGEYTLIVKLRDDTPWVRDPFIREQSLSSNWVWRVIIQTPPGDRTADGQLNYLDVLDFLTDFAAADPSADLAPPLGEFDFEDVLEFLDRFSTPCG